VAVAGRTTHECVLSLIAPALEKLPSGRALRFARPDPLPAAGSKPKVTAVEQEIEQTHLAMGFHAMGRQDERRFALKLLSVILGENMSSRLFQKLRERHGFCYSIQSGLVSLEDTGALTVFAALDSSKLEKAVRLILRELDRVCSQPPSRSELRKAQDYTIGQTLMGLESTTNQMMWIGESLLGYGKVLDPAQVEQRLLAVTPGDVCAAARDCLERSRLGLAIAGTGAQAGIDKIRSWLD